MKFLKLNDFESLINGDFALDHPEGQKKLRLTEAKPLSKAPVLDNQSPRGRPDGPFSLVFEGDEDEGFAQGSFKMRHTSIGEFDIFLVPIERAGNRIRYEAVFN